jgi:geranylgeranyl pyrophosphate synthase
LVDLLGVIFQIRDDYQNLSSVTYAQNKGFGEDITEGKFSYPIIHSIRNSPGHTQLLNILRQKPEEDSVKQYAIRIVESTGSLAYTREKIASLVYQARSLIQELPLMDDDLKGVQKILDFLDLKE